MNDAKDTPRVIDECQRLQRLTPHRLDRLAQNTELIARSVAQTGLVTNSTIAEIDRRLETRPVKRLTYHLERILTIGAVLGTMVVTFWLTDFLGTKLLHYLFDRFR